MTVFWNHDRAFINTGKCNVILYDHLFMNTGSSQCYKMKGVLGHDSALQGYTGPGTTQANEMNFVMNHAPDAGSIVCPQCYEF